MNLKPTDAGTAAVISGSTPTTPPPPRKEIVPLISSHDAQKNLWRLFKISMGKFRVPKIRGSCFVRPSAYLRHVKTLPRSRLRAKLKQKNATVEKVTKVLSASCRPLWRRQTILFTQTLHYNCAVIVLAGLDMACS